MKAWSSRGGVVGITPYAPFIRTDGTPTIDDYIDHVEYAIQLLGPEHVAIATDMFDGKTKVNWATPWRSDAHKHELQSIMRISYAAFCLKKKKPITSTHHTYTRLPTFT